tara:strand:- start:34 stop:438 length:405 start_codon:yes stop_codon:yes gene_type:complete
MPQPAPSQTGEFAPSPLLQIRLTLDSPDHLASEERTRWVALVTLGVHGLRVAANHPALAAIELHREAFDPELLFGLDDEGDELEDGDGEPCPLVGGDVLAASGGEADGEAGDDADLDDDDDLAGWCDSLDSLFD